MSQAGVGAHVRPSVPGSAGPRLVVATLASYVATSGLSAGGQDHPGGMTVDPSPTRVRTVWVRFHTRGFSLAGKEQRGCSSS